MSKCDISANSRGWVALILLFILILPIYSNTFHAAWHLDDQPNIVTNKGLHIDNLMPATLWKTLFAHPGSKEKLYRPLACLTFAINWYFGKHNTIGYHAVNIIIHILNAFFLYLTILYLFKTPRLKSRYQSEDAYFISLLGAALWALNPIQTQAITYIVQRMASMAAMFYILGIYFYLKGRLSNIQRHQILFYVACFVSFCLSMGSKENAVMMPFSLILVEIVFFQGIGQSTAHTKKFWTALAIIVCTLFIIYASFMFSKVNLSTIFDHTSDRSFSIYERLLTESRIVLHYLSQIFYPIPTRLSIEHDIVVSTSILKPLTTLPSILIIFGMIGLSLLRLWKNPLIAFAILFFFLNHVVESTVIPLELIFEHRNYLPSAFLFLPIAAGIKTLLNVYTKKKFFMRSCIISFVVLLMVGLGWSTFLRNNVWKNKQTLWQDAALKAPGSARPLNILAIDLAWGANSDPRRYDKALALFRKSLSLYKHRSFHIADILGNMASVNSNNHQYERAVNLHKRALKLDPGFTKCRYDLTNTLVLMGRWEEASKQADLVISKGSVKDDYYNLKGFILLWQKKPDLALPYFQKALSLSPNKANILLNTGVALNLLGNHQNAEWFLLRAVKNSPSDINSLFALIENCVRADDMLKADIYVERLVSSFSLDLVTRNLETLPENYRFAPISKEIIAPLIEMKFREKFANYKLKINNKALNYHLSELPD